MTNVCIFGDSIGKGVVLDPETGKYRLSRFMNMEPLASDQSVNLKNYARFGCTSTDGLWTAEHYAGELSAYDWAILEFGGNDCNFAWNEIAEAPEREHLPKNSPEVFVETYEKIIRTVQSAGAKPVLLTLPPLDAKRFFATISAGVNAQNILNWFGGVDMIYRWQELYSLAVPKLGAKLGVPVIDVRSEFIRRIDLPECIGQDGMHLTKKGYELLVRTVYDQMQSLL